MTLFYDVLEAKLILSELELSSEQKNFFNNFLERVSRISEDLEEMEVDLDEPSPATSPPPCSPAPSSSSLGDLSLFSDSSTNEKLETITSALSSINETLGIMVADSQLIKQRILLTDSRIRDIVGVCESTMDQAEDISRRQKAMHLRCFEYLTTIREDIIGRIDSTFESQKFDLQGLREAIQLFDRANDYLLKEINRLAGHPNI